LADAPDLGACIVLLESATTETEIRQARLVTLSWISAGLAKEANAEMAILKGGG